jgi:formyl-CoA transferase
MPAGRSTACLKMRRPRGEGKTRGHYRRMNTTDTITGKQEGSTHGKSSDASPGSAGPGRPVLEDIRILDFGRYIACPYGGMLLADMGADVIRVEPPGGTEDRGVGAFAPGTGSSLPYGLISCRNKKDITLDIRKDEGREILHRLAATADVVMHNFAPGSPEAGILSYDHLSAINPRIIVVSVSGFGKTGPYAQRPGFDSVAQGLSSMMSWTGFPGSPPTRAALAVVDCATGIMAAYSTVLCLLDRHRTGRGQEVDLGLLDTAVSFVATMGIAAEVVLLNHERPQVGNHSYYNFSDSFQTRDGRWVMISAIGNRIWRRLVKALGADELADDPRFASDMLRFENRHLLQPLISRLAGGYTAGEFVHLLQEARVPCGEIKTPAEMVQDPQIRAREMLVSVAYPGVGDVPLPGIVPKLSHSPGRIAKRASLLGEDNEELYGHLLGLSGERLQQLREKGVI